MSDFVTDKDIWKCTNFASDDSKSNRKMTFLYTKYTQESPNSDFRLFLKLKF